MAKHLSPYTGDQYDNAVKYIIQQQLLGNDKIIESTPENPVDLDNMINSEGKFTMENFTGAAEGTESGKPIEVEVFKYPDGSPGQRYDKDGVTVERKYDTETEAWSDWKPVQAFGIVTGDEVLDVATDTIVYRVVKDASEVTPIEEEEDTL